jgi:hypothetical protein
MEPAGCNCPMIPAAASSHSNLVKTKKPPRSRKTSEALVCGRY